MRLINVLQDFISPKDVIWRCFVVVVQDKKEKRFFCICFHHFVHACGCMSFDKPSVLLYCTSVLVFYNFVTCSFSLLCILLVLHFLCFGRNLVSVIMFQKNCLSLTCSWKGKGPAPIHSLQVQSHLCQPLHYPVAFFQITPEAFLRNSLDFSSSRAINSLKPHAFSYTVMDHAFSL